MDDSSGFSLRRPEGQFSSPSEPIAGGVFHKAYRTEPRREQQLKCHHSAWLPQNDALMAIWARNALFTCRRESLVGKVLVFLQIQDEQQNVSVCIVPLDEQLYPRHTG
jgi:hypothetical protein